MDDPDRRTPREKKIRRAIVFFSSCQTSLGAVLIAMSFTAFASSSSDKIRRSCPYWSGFTVLFTGAVGFLTWRQLSIISIGIYTFLSAVSVIVHLVATVLTGDTASFLKSLQSCQDVTFEHACKCCVDSSNCKSPYTFPSVRDCSILNGFLKDIMYGVCAVNVVCCLICITVTVMGCTLVAQYSRYSQAFRWSQRSRQDIPRDHRNNWFLFPSDPMTSIPPCAPPVYYPVQNNSMDSASRYRRPPTVFDPVDFPPPYTSREPSLCGTLGSQEYQAMRYTLTPQGSEGVSLDEGSGLETGYQAYEGNIEGQGTSLVPDNSVRNLDYVIEVGSDCERELGSTAALAVDEAIQVEGTGLSMRRTQENEVGGSDRDVEPYLQLSHESQGLLSNQKVSASSESDSPSDNVFTSTPSFERGMTQQEPGTSRSEMLFMRADNRVGQRRHSCPQNEVYSARDEIYRSIIAPNVNPWARRTMSEQESRRSCDRLNPVWQRRLRANSIPFCTTLLDPLFSLHTRCQTACVAVGETSGDNTPGVRKPNESSADTVGSEEAGSLFRHFKERKATRSKRHRRSKRPRNNPDHILERETGKETSYAIGAVAKESCVGVCKETVL